jgi:hypothetical protein
MTFLVHIVLKECRLQAGGAVDKIVRIVAGVRRKVAMAQPVERD